MTMMREFRRRNRKRKRKRDLYKKQKKKRKTTLVHNDHLFSCDIRLKLISLRTYKRRRLVFFSAFSGRKLCLTIMGPHDKKRKQEQKKSKEKFFKKWKRFFIGKTLGKIDGPSLLRTNCFGWIRTPLMQRAFFFFFGDFRARINVTFEQQINQIASIILSGATIPRYSNARRKKKKTNVLVLNSVNIWNFSSVFRSRFTP